MGIFYLKKLNGQCSKGQNKNVFKKMNIFKNQGISQSILYIFFSSSWNIILGQQ